MDIKLANEIIACLPKERTLFRYHEDRYAFMLLERFIGDRMAIADIKASPFAKLLNRPAIRKIVAGKGNGWLEREDLIAYSPRELEHYVLTIGKWGWKMRRSWCQTSRNGANIVLQMNFSRKHDGAYRKLVDPDDYKPYVSELHPVCMRGRNTLAWARLDMDFDTGEALVEEIQNDWLRETLSDLKSARAAMYKRQDKPAEEVMVRYAQDVRAVDVIHYVEKVLQPHFRSWSEAMLAATIWFLREEMGLRRIWYHDHETGARLKQIQRDKPPRSIYTDLPKRFCFERTTHAPLFLATSAPKKYKRRFKKGLEHFWCLNL